VKIYVKKYFWSILAIVLILLRWIGGMFPASIEFVYSRGFFLGIRAVFDYTIGLLPIPMFYVFFILLVVFLVKYIKQGFQIKKPFKERITKFGFHILRFVSIIIVWFLVIWGYNYGRVSIESQLDLTLKPLSIEEIKEETQWATRKAIELRKLVGGIDTSALGQEFLPKDLENEMRASLKNVLAELGYPTFGRVRARQLYPGTLLRLRTSGVYWFFVGEGNIDNGLHPLQKPFTTAHEMAHGYGFGDEGTCNFLAYLTCLKSSHAYVRYAGMLTYWRYIAREYKIREPEEYQAFRDANLSKGIANDLEAIYENGRKYPSLFDGVRDATYDTYLKAQGLDDGLENYNRIVVLVNGWKRKE
jgi:hypothetical protein